MAAKYILAAMAVAFFAMGVTRMARGQRAHPQSRTWLLIALMFGVVSVFLFLQG